MTILPVKPPCSKIIISRDATLLVLVVADHVVCCQIFGFWKTCLLVTHYGRSFVNFLDGLPLEPVPFNMQYFWKWTFLPQLWPVTFDLSDDPTPEPLTFILWILLKLTCFKDMLINSSIAKVYYFGIKGWSWYFSLLVSGSHLFESTRLRYPPIAYCTRDSRLMISSGYITSISQIQSFLINFITSLYLWIPQRQNMVSELSSKIRLM